MRSVFHARALLLALLFMVPALVHAQSTTIIVVRHAEKADASADPALSAAGQRRASALAAALADARVSAIYTTQFARTRLTAEPLATKLGITPTIVQAGGDAAAHAAEIAQRSRTENAGKVVLVVGHSNTVPAIVTALGGGDVGRINDEEYDHMYIVTIDAAGTRVVRAGYPPPRPAAR